MKKVTKIIFTFLLAALMIGVVDQFSIKSGAAESKKIKCTDSISDPNVSGMKIGDTRTFYFEKDLNGDKKKEIVSLVLKKTDGYYEYDSVYSYTIKVGKKKLLSGNCNGEYGDNEYGMIPYIKTIDINKKDKYTEIMINSGVNYNSLSLYNFYRYNGKKVKLLISMKSESLAPSAKQKDNDYLQCEVDVYSDAIGRIEIEADLNSKGIVKNKTYKTTKYYQSEREYTFNRSLTLYKKADGKNTAGNVSAYDTGYITKVKIDKEGKISYIYVKLKNGKSGWLNIKGFDSYIISDAITAA